MLLFYIKFIWVLGLNNEFILWIQITLRNKIYAMGRC
jgi:hypothetical protein